MLLKNIFKSLNALILKSSFVGSPIIDCGLAPHSLRSDPILIPQVDFIMTFSV